MRADGSRPEPGEPGQTSAEAARCRRYGAVSRIAALVVLATGAAVLAGWAPDIAPLKQVLPGYAAMVPLTAVGLLLSGLSLLLRTVRPGRWRHAVGTVSAGLLVLLGVVSALHHLTGVEPGGGLLFPAAVAADPAAPDPWPSPTPAAAFVLAGAALLLLGTRVRYRFRAAQLLALGVGFIAAHALILYSYDIGVLLGLTPFPPMALHTAAALFVLAVGILLARPDRGLMRIVIADDLGGHLARKVLPVALVAPVIFGLIRVLGVETGLFGPVEGLALVLALSMAAFVALVWWTAGTIHRLDAARQRALVDAEAERAVRAKAEARLRLALRAALMGLWNWVIPSGRIAWSEDLEETHGVRSAESATTFDAIWRFIHPDDRERVRTAIDQMLRADEPFHIEYPIVQPGGRVRWIEAWGQAVRTPAGEPERVVGLYRDVTDRVEAHEAEARLAAIVGSTLDAIISGDTDGTITSWNRGAERVYGYTAEEMIGQSVFLLATPDRRRETSAILARLRRGERVEQFETVRRRKDGRLIDVSMTISPIPDELGRVAGWSAIVRDITAQKQVAAERERSFQREQEARAEAEAARRAAERHARQEAALRRAAEALTATYMPDEVIRGVADTALEATGADGTFVLRLSRNLRDLRVVAAAGNHVPAVGRRFPFRGSATKRVLERGAPEHLRLDGRGEAVVAEELRESCARCSAIVVPLVDSGEQIGSLILVRAPEHAPFDAEEVGRAGTFAHLASLALRKIHLLEDAERRRKETEHLLESRSRLIRGFSHDVKNPLGAAEGRLALIEDGILGRLDPRQRSSVAQARASIRTALRLIDSLVELGRAEVDRIELQLAPVDVRGVASEVVEEYRGAATEKGLELELRSAAALPSTNSDPDRIRQILANLIVNALKYTERGRVTVTIDLREDDRRAPGPGFWIAVTITDTGPGIPQDKQEAIFGEFVRLEPGRGRGAGLGLAISRRIAQLLGGDITLESEVSKGSTFTLWLPLELPAALRPKRETERAHGAEPGGPARAANGASPEAPGNGPAARRRHTAEDGGEDTAELARLRALVEKQERQLEEHRLLAHATAALSASLDYEATLGRLARLAVPRLADLCTVDVVTETGAIRRVAVVHRDHEKQDIAARMREFPPLPERSPHARVLRSGRPQILREVTDERLREIARNDEHLRVLRALKPRSMILVPLAARGHTLGMMVLMRTGDDGEPYDDDDVRLAMELGRRAAIAVDNARLYEASQAASQAKSDFLAVMSHELRTPLTAIVGYQELLAAGIAGRVTEEQMKYLRRIAASALHLREVIEEILTFSGLEAGRETVRPEVTDLTLLARDTADVVEPAARAKGLAFEVDLPAGPVAATTDPAKLRRILLNLLNNAVSFTDEGNVRLSLVRANGSAIFRVQDTGIGIAQPSLEKIFEPFWQEQRGLTREVGGTGLGLAVARRLARMLGGDVTVESEVGKGSTFTVRVPLTPPERSGAAGAPQRGSPDRSG